MRYNQNMPDSDKKDFFISYNHRDEPWAEWIAWALEDAGYSTIVQAWDIRPGNNFVVAMQDAAAQADRTIAVLSPNYLGSEFVKPEWAAAFADDPAGVKARLVPVLVERCELPGMLAQINYVDVVGLDPVAAKTRLVAGVQPGRAKPAAPPPFPGADMAAKLPPPVVAAQRPAIAWRPLPTPLALMWRDAADRSSRGSSGSAALEIHLVPEAEQRLSVRSLTSLPDDLIRLGQEHDFFELGQHVDRVSSDALAAVHAEAGRARDSSGIVVTRSGQRGAWFTLPHDNMGSVFDFDDVSTRLERIVRMLLAIPVDLPDAVGVGARIEPTTLLQVEKVSVLGQRSSATMSFASRSVEPVLPDDVVGTAALQGDLPTFVDEVVARLEAKLRG